VRTCRYPSVTPSLENMNRPQATGALLIPFLHRDFSNFDRCRCSQLFQATAAANCWDLLWRRKASRIAALWPSNLVTFPTPHKEKDPTGTCQAECI
jgi:hypothetical protein